MTRPGSTALLCALLAGTALAAAPANAQGGTPAASTNSAPPAEQYAISPGGVDMRTGRYVYNQTDVSIGEDNETGGLALNRTMGGAIVGHINPFANFAHNFDVMATEKRIDIHNGRFSHDPGNPDHEISVHFGGRSETFRAYYNGGYVQESRSAFSRLTFSGTKAGAAVYTFQAADGTLAVFRPIAQSECSSALRCAFVSQIRHPDGTQLDFHYEEATSGTQRARLRRVTSNRGYALLLEYGGAWNLVTRACVLNLAQGPVPAGNACPSSARDSEYSYVSFGQEQRLASATDASGGVWGFSYDGGMGFIRPGETSPWLVNQIVEQTNNEGLVERIVVGQSFADQSPYSYAYDMTPPVEGQLPSIAGGWYGNGEGHVTEVRFAFPQYPRPEGGYGNVDEGGGSNSGPSIIVYQTTPGPDTITDPLGRTTTMDYCNPGTGSRQTNRCVVGLLRSFTDPEGIRTELSYDGWRNVSQVRRVAPAGSNLPDIVTSSTYSCTPQTPALCARPQTVTDANGNVSEFTYHPEHGGVLTETGPADANGIRPQTRHEYQLRHARVSDGAGGSVQMSPPVWLRTATSMCRTSAFTGVPATPCATPGDEVRTSYDYGPDSGTNNLQLRGEVVTADGQARRVCYGYDQDGRRISETGTGAGLTQCQ